MQEVERWLFQVIVLDVGVQGTNDDTQLFNSVEEKVEKTSKALELPDFDAKEWLQLWLWIFINYKNVLSVSLFICL